MKKTTILVGVVLILVIGALVWAGNSSRNQSQTSEPIKIGVALSLTGKAAEYGIKTKKGMELALKEVNESGSSIELVIEDEKSLPKDAVSVFQKLVTIDKVPVVVGLVGSGACMSAAPVAEASKIVMISTLCGTDKLKDAGDYVFRIRESGATHGVMMADLAFNNLTKRKAALLGAEAENGITYTESFKGAFEKLGGQVVFDEKFVEQSGDFRSALTKLKFTQPDVIYIAGTASDMAIILVQAKELGIKSTWMASPGAESSELIKAAKDASEELIVSTPAFNVDSKNSAVSEFVKSYRQAYNEEPNFSAANGYDSIKLLDEVTRKFGKDAESIKKGLYTIRDFPGVGGSFSIDSNGEVEKPISYKVVKNGQFVPLGL